MKVVLLSSANSIHTQRWANALVSRGVEVYLLSIHRALDGFDDRVNVHLLPITAPWGYISSSVALKKILARIQPDIVNVHYASGYGFLARLVGFKPTLLSVWGSDVYDFPEKSFFHRWLLKGNLKSATAIASTSHCMAKKTAETFQHKQVFITPFGIDEAIFFPKTLEHDNSTIVIGTVKTLKHVYGIDTLIKAFALVVQQYLGSHNLVLEITGGGPDMVALKNLAKSLGISEIVMFRGTVPHHQVVEHLNRLDIYVALSRYESFGVAILEASACEKPVVVSDADGPAEVTLDGQTGFVVPKENPQKATEAILKLVYDKKLRREMGKHGRMHALENYTWEKSLATMVDVYKKVINL